MPTTTTPTPPWYTWARREIGTAEIPGLKGSNERIENYRKVAKIKLAGDDSTIPWCVTGRTLISTPAGFTRADEVEMGMEVTGPSGLPRTVLAVASRMAETIRLRWHGGFLEITPEHPVLVRRSGDPEWVPAGQVLGGDRVLIVRPTLGVMSMDVDVAYALGMYVADGHGSSSRPEVAINDGHDQVERVSKALHAAGAPFSVSMRRTCAQFNIHRSTFQDLCHGFGRVSTEKQCDQVLGWTESARSAFLSGYLDGDGSRHVRSTGSARVSCTTVSMRLAFGIAAVARSLGHVVAVRRYERSTEAVIEGRTIHQQPEVFVAEWTEPRPTDRGLQAQDGEAGAWVLIKEDPVPTGETEPVYDFTVADEHAFVANGIAVHNCAIFANAALEANGIEGTRSAAARSFLDWGVKVGPSFGAVIVLSRGRNPALGHVGLYRGSTTVDGVKYVYLLGGNQGDKVSVAPFPASRVLGYRWPEGQPYDPKVNIDVKLNPVKPQKGVKTS